MIAADLFSLGRRVNFALPNATLRPTDAEMKIAAQALKITQAVSLAGLEPIHLGLNQTGRKP